MSCKFGIFTRSVRVKLLLNCYTAYIVAPPTPPHSLLQFTNRPFGHQARYARRLIIECGVPAGPCNKDTRGSVRYSISAPHTMQLGCAVSNVGQLYPLLGHFPVPEIHFAPLPFLTVTVILNRNHNTNPVLLPQPTAQNCSLRNRSHSRHLHDRICQITECNFTVRMYHNMNRLLYILALRFVLFLCTTAV